MKTGDSLGSFLNGDFGHFEQYEEDFEELLTKISRDLPAEVYGELREQLIDFFPSILRGLKTRVKLVVDSNIIVKDAFRVAQGKPSSTDRLLSSEFVDLFAPSEITREVQRDVETDIPPKVNISIAKGHARKLLEKVKKVPHTRSDALAKARALINERAPEDVPFLALAIDTGADAVVSYDKRAFDAQNEVKRWTLGETAKVVVTFESGTLSFYVVAKSAEAIAVGASLLLIGIARVIAEVLALIAEALTAVITGAADALAKVPDWVWALVAAAGIGVLVGAVLDEGFRKSVTDTISTALESVAKTLDSIAQGVRWIWKAAVEVLSMLWTLLGPVFDFMVLIAGVLVRRIALMLAQIIQLSAPE